MSDAIIHDSNPSFVLELVRALLLQLPASGAAGFEGLIATLIAAIVDVQVRLAKSGAQFGRDASSPRDLFAIALEVKRYDSALRLDDLLGKAASASFALGSDTDLWIVGTTAEVGDDIVRKVTTVVEASGMSALFLDWSPRPIPPLAILLASNIELTSAWFSEHAPAVEFRELAIALHAIRSSEAFLSAEKKLLNSLSSAQVGLDSLRKKNAAWLTQRWSDTLLSQQEFAQVIVPLDEAKGFVSGRAWRMGLDKQVKVKSVPSVLAIMGDEGVGKTWLIPDWWLNIPTRPILIPVLGKAVELLEPYAPFSSLGKILELQYRDAGINASGWEKRIQRWSARSATPDPWLVVVFDGLNERPELAWANLINSFGRSLNQAGALLVVTCRPGFWSREVAPRLSTNLVWDEVQVPEYSVSEVEMLFANRGVASELLPERLKSFLRNPRVCSVGLSLLDQLSATPGELTLERLQLEYWRLRMQERGNLVQHSAADFEKLLRAHAEEWLSDPSGQFLLDDLYSKSTLVKRNPTAIARDLSDIVEGRFMRASQDDHSSYEFRPEALFFALGLLLTDRLRRLGQAEMRVFSELIESLVEPVQGFTLTGRIVGAAFGLSCLDSRFPAEGRRALLKRWASLQNLDQEALDAMSPNVLIEPDVFCSVIEQMCKSKEYYPHRHDLEKFLFLHSDHPTVRLALDRQLPIWMGRWCRKPLAFPGDKEPKINRASVESNIRLLTAAEREQMLLHCSEVTEPISAHTDELAAFQLLSGPMAAGTRCIWAWSLAQAVAGDYKSSQEALEWAVRLNPWDWRSTATAVRSITSSVTQESSEPYRRAASIMLLLLGDSESEVRAEGLSGPISEREMWRRVTLFCDTNPHDPQSPAGSNISRTIEAVSALSVLDLRTNRFSNKEDLDFKMSMPALARFDIDVLVDVVRKLVSSVENREGMAFRALCWDLVKYSALLDHATVSILGRALDSFSTKVTDWTPDDELIVNELLRTILPHLSADLQLRTLLELPPPVKLFINIQGTLKRPEPSQLEAAFQQALASPGSAAVERVLFFASVHPVPFTPTIRQILKSQLASSSTVVRNISYEVIRRSGDVELNEYILSQANEAESNVFGRDDFYRIEAVTGAVILSGKADHLYLVPSELRQAAAAQMGNDAIAIVSEEIDASVRRLLEPISPDGQLRFPIIVDATPDGLMQRISLAHEVPEEGFADLVDADASARRFEETQHRRQHEYGELIRQLWKEGARTLLAVPSFRCIDRIVDQSPERVNQWLQSILAERDQQALTQVFHLGAALAGRYARVDGALASTVLRHLAGLQSLHRISTEPEHIPLYLSAVFSESNSPEMNALRDWIVAGATNDFELEVYARAASVCGGRSWLMEYIKMHHRDDHPGMQARAVTLAGFCSLEDDISFALTQSGSGFVAQVRKFAQKQRRRASWAEHWCRAALGAEKLVDFWRFGKLAEGVADRRFVGCFSNLPTDRPYIAFESELYERLEKAAEERSKKREQTLFGMKAPSAETVWALQSVHSQTKPIF